MATSAPASESARAIVLPIPCLAPVTRATFPANEKFGVLMAPSPPYSLSPFFRISNLFLLSDFHSIYVSITCQFFVPTLGKPFKRQARVNPALALSRKKRGEG